jgi:hypothetical protein
VTGPDVLFASLTFSLAAIAVPKQLKMAHSSPKSEILYSLNNNSLKYISFWGKSSHFALDRHSWPAAVMPVAPLSHTTARQAL